MTQKIHFFVAIYSESDIVILQLYREETVATVNLKGVYKLHIPPLSKVVVAE